MPKNPRGRKLSADVKSQAAVQLGRKGGQARARALGVRRRREIARKAAAARWKKQKN